MHGRELLRDVWDGARTQSARVILSFLGVTTGIVALVFLLAVIGGLRDRGRTMIRELGVNVFAVVRSDDRGPGSVSGQLGRRHVRLLTESQPGVIATAVRWQPLPESDINGGATLLAADEHLLAVRSWTLNRGRGFDPEDIRTHSRYALLGDALAKSLGVSIGNDIRIRSIPFRIIGILDGGAESLSVDALDPAMVSGERVVVIPWSVSPYRPDDVAGDGERVSAIFVKAPDSLDFGAVIRRTAAVLAAPDCQPGPLDWVTPGRLLEELQRLQRSILLAGGSIVVLCLVLGGATLSALLLAGIQARIPEIGLRRALGASSADVAVLFMSEALFITMSASLAGTTLAWLVLACGRDLLPFDVSMGAWTLLLPLVFGAGVGVLASFLPARAAARIAPAEALRND